MVGNVRAFWSGLKWFLLLVLGSALWTYLIAPFFGVLGGLAAAQYQRALILREQTGGSLDPFQAAVLSVPFPILLVVAFVAVFLAVLLVHVTLEIAKRSASRPTTAAEAESPFLRPRGLAFGKKLRDYYEANQYDPKMPSQFFIQFYVEICWFKDRFATAIGPEKVNFVEAPAIVGASADTVEWVVHSFNTEAGRIPADIPA